MWFNSVFFLLIFSTAQSIIYEDATKELLSYFDGPESKDLGRILRFKEEIADFSTKMIPIAESFAESIKTGKPINGHIYNMTKHISEKAFATTPPSYEYESDVQRAVRIVLTQIQIATTGSEQDVLAEMCLEKHGLIERMIQKHVGASCLQTFSTKTASMLFELIDSFQFVNYTLSKKREISQLKSDQARFNDLYAAVYFHLEKQRDRDLSEGKLREFIREKKDVKYENKVKLLEDLIHFFGISMYSPPTSPCLPLKVFLKRHFDRDYLLRLGDTVMNDIFATKFFTHICANVTNDGNPKAAEMYVKKADDNLDPVFTVLNAYFDYLLKSTWPVTEKELVKGFMKEASGGLQIEETAAEYQRIANFVHDRMKSIGHPSYFRQFLVTKEYPVAVDSPNFDYNCKENSCSRAVADGAQCVILRTPKDKSGLETTEFQNFVNFTERVKPKILEVLHSGYKNISEVVNTLDHDHSVSLATFVNHANYMVFHSNQYFGNCSIFYGYKTEEGENSSFLRVFSYHKDRTLFSKCHDWLIFVGL